MFNYWRYPVLFIALCCLLSSCASVQNDWEFAKRENSRKAYAKFLNKHPESEHTQVAQQLVKDISLGEAILSLAPSTEIRVDKNRNVIPNTWDTESIQTRLIPIIQDLLQKGANPKAYKITGYKPTTTTSTETKNENGFTQRITNTQMGSCGYLVPESSQTGMSYTEYCRSLKLDRVAAILRSHGVE